MSKKDNFKRIPASLTIECFVFHYLFIISYFTIFSNGSNVEKLRVNVKC